MKLNPFKFNEDRTFCEQLRLLLSNYQSTLPVIIIPLLIYWALVNPHNYTALGLWCASVIANHLIIHFFCRHHLNNISPTQLRKITWRFVLLNLIDGLLWGLLAWITFDNTNQSAFFMAFAVFAGMLGGGVATLSPIPLLFAVFALPQTLAFSIKLWSMGEPTYLAMSLGILIYLATLFGQVLNSAKAVRRSILLSFDLEDSHDKLRKIEHKQTLSKERQRIMQDMHDGLGSSLISALRVVERGNMTDAELALILKGCIDDFKLAIDAMEPIEENLLLLLATLRFRLGPRLEGAQIDLIWQVETLPSLEWLDPTSALHILRILQEAIANTIKHTQATQLQITTSVEGEFVVVKVIDNGQGFDIESINSTRGKGLPSQKNRAFTIGANIQWCSSPAGTCVKLILPVNHAN